MQDLNLVDIVCIFGKFQITNIMYIRVCILVSSRHPSMLHQIGTRLIQSTNQSVPCLSSFSLKPIMVLILLKRSKMACRIGLIVSQIHN